MIVYQILPRLWGEGRMSSIDDALFAHLKSLGVTHIWYTGIPRHATGESFVKGNPGSPYAIEDWFDVNPYLADNKKNRRNEFKQLVSRTHAAGFKVLTDYIPNHVARNYAGPIPTYDWCDADWTDTKKVNYNDPATVPAMADVLSFWASLGVDGFRCDMIELVPQDALKSIFAAVRLKYPELIFVGEAYGRENYRSFIDYVGFDYLYDKSGTYDILRGVLGSCRTARELTWNWQFQGCLQPHMLSFLENHDEQRFASQWFAGDAARAFAALGFGLLFNGAPYMIYFGQEVGENASEGHEGRTSIFDWSKPSAIAALWRSLHGGRLSAGQPAILARYRKLMKLSQTELFLEGKVWDLCYCNGDRMDLDRSFAFLRYNERKASLVFCNFSGERVSRDLFIPREVFGTEPFTVKVEAGAYDASIVEINRPRA